jgi:hypothetical protein
MMTCKCGSSRILSVSGKVSDMCDIRIGNNSRDGYVPGGLNIGSGDYLEFDLCLDCGQHQGVFPVTEKAVNEVF